MIYPRKLIGRWQGANAYYHAVDSNEFPIQRTAVCGRTPYSGWEARQGSEVTCPRCLKRMECATPQPAPQAPKAD